VRNQPLGTAAWLALARRPPMQKTTVSNFFMGFSSS
jgi:hypothetical protein